MPGCGSPRIIPAGDIPQYGTCDESYSSFGSEFQAAHQTSLHAGQLGIPDELLLSEKGVLIIDRKEIEGITSGALDAEEGEPGPSYIEGDHTGGLEFRSITVATPRL